MATILITGGTGLVGKALGQALLEKGYRVIILSRQVDKKSETPGLSYATWNVAAQTIDKEAIAKADYIIHLAGAGVADKRWTKKRKQEIVDSRVNSSKLIVDSFKTIPNKVKAVVSASAIGWYGPDPAIPNPKPFTEEAAANDDFLGTTCKLWEESIEPVTQLGIRLVKLRTGIVLSNEGGALKEFLKPLKFGVAAILASGKQIISWIHIDDLVNMYVAAIENENINGVYNAVAPKPVSNKELTLELAKSRKKFFIPIHVPSFILKIMLGEMSTEVLKSATVSSNKIQRSGFDFTYPAIKEALANKL
ncbi:MAG: TIGR01777 family oxidoreductase [Bacteroidota bacterium]|nr:TIGR01777 family oxidoreductase [Bacteroidota bacterium]